MNDKKNDLEKRYDLPYFKSERHQIVYALVEENGSNNKLMFLPGRGLSFAIAPRLYADPEAADEWREQLIAFLREPNDVPPELLELAVKRVDERRADMAHRIRTPEFESDRDRLLFALNDTDSEKQQHELTGYTEVRANPDLAQEWYRNTLETLLDGMDEDDPRIVRDDTHRALCDALSELEYLWDEEIEPMLRPHDRYIDEVADEDCDEKEYDRLEAEDETVAAWLHLFSSRDLTEPDWRGSKTREEWRAEILRDRTEAEVRKTDLRAERALKNVNRYFDREQKK